MATATTIKERPILFSTTMVRAILDGRKTQTRRVLTTQPLDIVPFKGKYRGKRWVSLLERDPNRGGVFTCKHGAPGDRLWVRESCWLRPERTRKMLREGADTWPAVIYAADQSETDREWTKEHGWLRRNSIHMPRKLCRLLLEITNVRVERLQEISEADAVAEGAPVEFRTVIPTSGKPWSIPNSHRGGFVNLWEKLNAKRGFSWKSNPWVWAVSFKQLEPSHA